MSSAENCAVYHMQKGLHAKCLVLAEAADMSSGTNCLSFVDHVCDFLRLCPVGDSTAIQSGLRQKLS